MDDERAPAVDAWAALRALTPARIGLGRAGVSVPTRPQLAFQLAHARARDAVHAALDVPALRAGIEALGHETLALHSAAPDRGSYLQRPDLGRRLSAASRATLAAGATGRVDAVFVVADGLSALAVQRHASALLARVLPALQGEGWTLAPVVVVEQGRVAVADEVGELLGADLAVILLGERPGLSAPDSLGVYLTWQPRVGTPDARRNCISNVHGAGLSADDAARRLTYLLRESRRRQLSGVALKDESDVPPLSP